MKPKTPVTAVPSKYMRLQPILSDKWPENGIEKNDTTEAVSTAISNRSRHPEDCRSISKDESSEDIEWRLFAHPGQGGQQDLFGLPPDYFESAGLFDTVLRHQSRKGGGLK